jgi:hypothetical protein
MCCLTHHIYIYIFYFEPLIHIDSILFGYFRAFYGTSHYGGVMCFVHMRNLENVNI